jgi:hypothetical protein
MTVHLVRRTVVAESVGRAWARFVADYPGSCPGADHDCPSAGVVVVEHSGEPLVLAAWRPRDAQPKVALAALDRAVASAPGAALRVAGPSLAWPPV